MKSNHTRLDREHVLLLYDLKKSEQALTQFCSINAGALSGRQLLHLIGLSKDAKSRQHCAKRAFRTHLKADRIDEARSIIERSRRH